MGSSCEQGFSLEKYNKNFSIVFDFILHYDVLFDYLAIPTTTIIQNPCAFSPCLNGGLCSRTSMGGFMCTCLPNFAGLRCEDIITTITTSTIPTTSIEQIIRTNDACKDNPCLNAGSCILNGIGGFICQCLNGFIGNRCEARGKNCSFMLKSKLFFDFNLVDIAPLQNSTFSLINVGFDFYFL